MLVLGCSRRTALGQGIAQGSAELFIEHLSVEHLEPEAPGLAVLGIDVPRPRFSWRLAPAAGAAARAVAQTAFRVVVTESLTDKPLWDTGQLASNSTRLIAYGGQPLASDTLYAWRVECWGSARLANYAMVTAAFRTGLFDRADWLGARWITPGFGRSLLRSPVLRIDDPVAEATVSLAGVGYFELTVNGRRVGEGRKWDVAFSAYAQRVHYVTFDLKPFLTVGDNVLGVELGNSWFGAAGWYQQPPYMGCSSAADPEHHGQGGGTCNGGGFAYNVPNQLILRARVSYFNGRTAVLTSGGGGGGVGGSENASPSQGWMAGVGPITFDSLYDGEHYDARLEQPGWDSPSFSAGAATNWSAAEAVPDVANPLVDAALSAQLYEPIKVVEAQPPVSRWLSGTGSHIFDFGTNMVGVIRLRITGVEPGRKVTLKHAEVTMHPPYGPQDGSLYYGSLRNAHATDVYTMKGGVEAEVFEPKFTSHGFRYLELIGLGYAPEDADVTRLVAHNTVATSSSFAANAGAEVLNRINTGCRNSISGNLLGGPGSCGGRDERQFFTGDTAMAGEASLIQYELPALYTHSLLTMSDQQRADGSVGDYFPDTVGDNRDGHANWGTAFLYVTWLLWQYHGDTTVIDRHRPQLERYVEFHELQYRKTAGSGLAHFWPSCIHGWTVVGPVSNCSLMTSFAYVNELRMMAEMAGATATAASGNTSSSGHYWALHRARLATYHTSFYNSSIASYGADTLDDLGMSLWLDAPPTPSIREAVAARLAAKVDEQLAIVNPNSSVVATGTAMSGGIGIRCLYEALARNGHADVALRLALRKTYPSYGYMFYNEFEPATSMWELWASDTGNPSMDSRNHIYSASITTFLYKYLAGVDRLTPGFDRAVIAPINLPLSASGFGGSIDALTTVAASVGTPHGAISSAWTLLNAAGGGDTDCDVEAEGNCATCGHVHVSCTGSQVITAVKFADFGTVVGSCAAGLGPGSCHVGPNVSMYVAKRCVGNHTCSVAVDWKVFGDPCPGKKKTLGVEVVCGGAPGTPSRPVYRLEVVIPVGVDADVVVPLRGANAGAVKITEGGAGVWSNGRFAGSTAVPGVRIATVDPQLGGIRFEVAQGTYVFELLVV